VINEVDGDIDKGSVLRSVGVDPNNPVDPSFMVPAAQYYALLEQLIAVDRNPIALPLRVGAAMRCDECGAFGLGVEIGDQYSGLV
jgi:hypothetical protein